MTTIETAFTNWIKMMRAMKTLLLISQRTISQRKRQSREKNAIGDDDCSESYFVPNEFIFHSHVACVLWGPFAEDNKKLLIFLLGKHQIILHFL